MNQIYYQLELCSYIIWPLIAVILGKTATSVVTEKAIKCFHVIRNTTHILWYAVDYGHVLGPKDNALILCKST